MNIDILRLVSYDIYNDFDDTSYPLDLEGWNSTHGIFQQLIEEYKPKTIIEVGTWKGASAINMAEIAESRGLDTKIICVDTFLGWPEANLKMQYGFPKLYEQFLANVVKTKHTNTIIPFPQTSELAAIWMDSKNMKAELIYIDASHYFSAVYDDMARYWTIVEIGGCLFGDDYSRSGVKQAVDLFVDIHKLKCEIYDEKWIIRKEKEFEPIESHEFLYKNFKK